MSTIAATLRGLLPRRPFPAGRRLPRAGPATRGIRILPTRSGFIFLAMLAALLLGAVNHNNNLGYLLTFLLGGMALASLFHSRRNLTRIAAVSIRARPVFAGQQAVFAITLKPTLATRPALSFSFAGGEPTSVNLGGESKATVQVAVVAQRRGMLRPGPLALATTWPLGLFRAWREIPVRGICLVYPRPVAGPLVCVPGPEDRENEGDAGGGGVEDFSGLDAYQPGDPLRQVSWKAYSRGQGLYSKKFTGRQGKSVYFNPATLPGPDLEWKLARICFMILKAEAMRLAYGLQLGNRLVKADLGEKHKRRCLRELALTSQREPDVP